MTQKTKTYLIWTIGALVAMFLWIFVAVALTGGRETDEFTDIDKIIMTVFCVVEIATVVIAFFFAVKVGVEHGKKLRQGSHPAETNVEKNFSKRGSVLLIVAVVLAFGAMISGIVLGKNLSVQVQELSQWVLGISCALAAVMLLLNIVLEKWYVGRLKKQQVGQVQQFIYSHRDRAEETAVRKLSFIKRWRLLTSSYAVLLGILGLCVAMCAGILYSSGSVITFCFVAALLVMCAFSRVRFQPSQNVFDADKAYVTENQYPHLYALAQKAAETIDCSGKIRIALLPNCNAGIAKVGPIYSVQLGVILLCALSEEELYSILLHEFAHMTGHNNKAMKERSYNTWLSEGKTSGITNLFFCFFDAVYTLQFGLYDYASSILIESAADQAMLLSGDVPAAGSALLKLKYYELFFWEKGTRDGTCMYELEQPDKQLLAKELQEFRQAMSRRHEKWEQLVDVEIQSRSASHPTLKSRLEALGIRQPALITAMDASDYTRECEQALAYVDGLIYEDLAENYEERRKVFYLEPKAQVEAWEKAGKPLIAQEYADIIWALRQLGRNLEAIELCERAIEGLSDTASCNGYFIRGCYRLHSYDSRGIADIYAAMENNNNYMEEGLENIGKFCCLTGNQKELDIYRQKAVVLVQKHQDQYSQTEILNPKDQLSAENLPEGMLEEILDYIRSVDGGQIEKIYLVRKTITEDFFTSAFVIRFDPEAVEAACGEIMHKIFQYLDTCSDWQFSLFDYQDVLNVPVYKIENSCVYSKRN